MLIRTLYYRLELLIWALLDSLPFIVLFGVMAKIFAGQDQVQGYTTANIIQYYLIVFLIQTLSDVHFEGWRCQEIREGRIDFYLARPFAYINDIIWKSMSSKCTYFLISFPIYAVLYFSFASLYQVPLLPIMSSGFLFFLFLLIVAYSLNIMVGLWIVMGTFWLEGSNGLEHFKWIAISLFSGAMIPVALMPGWLKSIVEILPFKYLYAVPIGVLQHTYTFTKYDGVYLTVLTCFMLWFTFLFWKKSIFQYSSAN